MEGGAPVAAAEGSAPPVFRERLTAPLVPDAWRFALPLAAAAALAAALGAFWLGVPLGVAAGFVLWFFRNPARTAAAAAAAPGAVLAPADGRVVEAGEVELPGGEKAQRVGIFLSIFDVHVNRAPVAGRVLGIERSGDAYLAAFNPAAARRNVQATLRLETQEGHRVQVVQITGLIARRIVCQPEPGEWLGRGVRYGLIRFGSRTDVILPAASRLCVGRGERVRGGASLVARLPEAAA